MRRGMKIALGSVLTTMGAAGLVGAFLAPVPLHAAAPSAEGQEGTHQVVGAVRGVDAVNRMHAMLQACSAMTREFMQPRPASGT